VTGAYANGHEEYSYLLAGHDSRFMRWFMLSLALHAAVAGALWLESRLIDAPQLRREKAMMVQPARWGELERPKQWLPRKTPTPELPKPEAVKVTPTPNTPAPKVEKKQTDPKSQANSEQARRDRMAKALEKVKASADDAKYGDPRGLKGAALDNAIAVLGSAYAAQLRDVFRDNWNVPSVIPEAELKQLSCKILLKIDRSGKIVQQKLESGSGNQHFDSSALKAVKTTVQVPLPDDVLRDIVFREGILINFSWLED